MFDKIRNAVSNVGDLGNLGDLQQYVEGISFPASKEEIITQLQENGAQEELIAKVQEIGQDRFGGPMELIQNFLGNR